MTTVVPSSRERHSYYPSTPSGCPMAQRYYLEGTDADSSKNPAHGYSPKHYPRLVPSSTAFSSLPSPDFNQTTADRLPPTPASIGSISFNTRDDQSIEEIIFPTYEKDYFQQEPRTFNQRSFEPFTDFQRSAPQTPAADDSSVEEEPSRHVDYLSHEWKEEDIWTSWRYIATRRRVYDNGVRLENASWRTWAKLKLHLGTVSPDALNWMKDHDVTWLYGPLKTCSARETMNVSPPPSCETPNLYLDRKSILKKRTASETILQRSLSQHTLLQHAGAILKAQEAENHRTRPSFSNYRHEFSFVSNQSSSHPSDTPFDNTETSTSPSGIGSPSERRHIHFNNEVVQCIAVEVKEEEDEWPGLSEDESSDDGVVMKQFASEASASGRSTPRSSFSCENKTIAPLPPTTLKYRGDTPEPPGGSIMNRWSGYLSSSRLISSSSSSIETVRPSESPSTDFLLDEDPNTSHYDWDEDQFSEPSRPWFVNPGEDEDLDQQFNIASLGMFSDEQEPSSSGIFDRLVDTVNTARDIAHVIWNVGWPR